MAVIDGVEIFFQDFPFGINLFQPQGQKELFKFSLPGPFMGEKEILGELLADGAATLADFFCS